MPPEECLVKLPTFYRPVYKTIYKEFKGIDQIISITGPRRVGKSTLIKQMIKSLIDEGVDPHRIIYYSMDDPSLYLSTADRDGLFDSLMEFALSIPDGKKTYVFLDEIQRFDRWELYLKKYYDLHYPVRFAVSGSASSPIFKKSRESLMGRIKDYHILPFSFREYALYHRRGHPSTIAEFERIHSIGETIMGMLAKHPEHRDTERVIVPEAAEELRNTLTADLNKFMLEGGFPEVWSFGDWQLKQSYLFDNQIEKVIMEDLALAVELRKPEKIKKFYISLLERPGQEINMQSVSSELEIGRQLLEKYFPLLEMTDLLRHVEKFTKGPIKVRRGNIKCYLVDLSLRNAILRISEDLFKDSATLGLYAENLVLNAIKKWEGTLEVSYHKDKYSEVDFIIHTGAKTYVPVEVKYQNNISASDLKACVSFCKKYRCGTAIIVTKNWNDFGPVGNLPVFRLPLPHFLLMFD